MKRSFLILLILTMVATGSTDAEKYFFQYERELQTSGKTILVLGNQIGSMSHTNSGAPPAAISATRAFMAATAAS